MTTLPAVTLEDGDATVPVSASVVRQILMRVWWVVCLLPALVLLAVAAGR
jgi:hypothetical protein